MTNPAEGPHREAGGQEAKPDTIRKRLDALFSMMGAVDRRPDLNLLKKKLDEWGFGQLGGADLEAFFKDMSDSDRQLVERACGNLGDRVASGGEPEAPPKVETAESKVGGGRREKEAAKGGKKPNRVFLGYAVEPDSDGNLVVYEKFETLDKRRGKYREQPTAMTAIVIPEDVAAKMKEDTSFRDAVVDWLDGRRRELGPESDSKDRLRLFPDRVEDEGAQETSFEPRWKYGTTTKAGKRQRESKDLSTGVTKWSDTDKALPVENPDEIPWDILDKIQKFEYGEMLRRGKAPAWEKRTYKEYVAEMKASGHDVTVPYWKDGGYNSWIGKAAQRRRENIMSEELTVRIVERWMKQLAQEAQRTRPTAAAEPAAPAPKEMKALPEWRGEAEQPEAPAESETAEPAETKPATGKDAIRDWVSWIAKPEVESDEVTEGQSDEAAGEVAGEPAAAAETVAPAVKEKMGAEPVTDESILKKARPLVSQQVSALSRLYKLPDEAADLAEWSAKVVRATLADSYRRQGDKETAVRLLKDDGIVGMLAEEAMAQINRPEDSAELDRRAEEMFRKHSPEKAIETRRTLGEEIASSLAEFSRDPGFEAAVNRLAELARAVLKNGMGRESARLDESGNLTVTDGGKFDYSMKSMYRILAKK
jgi:hypothetical protein